ncbi:hypothetical protein D3C87_813220 [compost metagenome]
MRQAAHRAGDFHHLLERQILMRLRFQCPRLDLCQQRFDAGRARGVDAHGERIDEHTDQAFGFSAAAVGHRRADHHIGLPGQPTHQQRPGTHQGHEQGRAMTLAQRFEASTQALVQQHFDVAAGVILLRRSRAIGGQRQQGRRTVEGLLPILALLLQHFTAEPAPLP